jgi:outer membrane murein-binding lipoprotein Lpp
MLDLEAIKARRQAYLDDRTDHIDTLIETAADVPTLVAEVERLREDYEAARRDADVRQSIADTRQERIEKLTEILRVNGDRLTAARAERDEARAEVERLTTDTLGTLYETIPFGHANGPGEGE